MIMIIFLMLMISVVLALEVNKFSDGSSSTSLTFSPNSSRYINISIPNNANITNATVNITGLSGYCLQETANETSQCGGLSTGGYSWNGTWESDTGNLGPANFTLDGNYNTAGQPNGFASAKTFFWVNYSKPSNTFNNSKWQVKNQFDLPDETRNFSIPGNCWNQDSLQFRIELQGCPTAGCFNNITCFDSSEWLQISYGTGARLWEETMFWSKYPTNITVKSDNDVAYINLTEFNGSSTINLNISALQGCVDTCANPTGGNCKCELNLTSISTGKLQLSNLNIPYVSIEGSLIFLNTTDWDGSFSTTDNVTRTFSINSTKTVNQTDCGFNVSATSLRDILIINDTNFTIENKTSKDVTVSFVNPLAVDYSAGGTVLWVYCGLNKTSNIDVEFVVTSPPVSTGGGGGGGGGITILSGNNTPILFFGINTLSFTVISTPKTTEKTIKVINLANVTFNGDLTIEGTVAKWLDAKVCDVNILECKTEDIEINGSETKLLVINGNFDTNLGRGGDGILKLSEDNGFDKTFELGLVVERPPLYALYNFIANRLDTTELNALLLTYGLISGLTILTLISVGSGRF